MAKEKMQTRLSKWEKPEKIEIPFSFDEEEPDENEKEAMEFLDKKRADFRKESDENIDDWFTNMGLIKSCRELIFDINDEGIPFFHAVGYSLNIKSGYLERGLSFEILPDNKNHELNEEIRNVLAIAHICEVPVYPNSDDLIEELAKYHRELLLKGFTAPDEEGNKVILKLTRAPGKEIENIDHLKKINFTHAIPPAEWAIIRKSINDELGLLSEAQKLLSNLDLAISELTEKLRSKRRNESKLQECLTNHPILFGLNYIEIIPKHRLGAEYEMDYALKRFSGLYDLVEIESSNLPLFNKKGNPSHHLIHAEQQVIDWLSWLEKHNSYASEYLPDIMNPVGFIIIGTDETLGNNRKKLIQRNSIFRNKFQILTYNDLLKRSKSIRDVLKQNNIVAQQSKSSGRVRV